MKDYSTRTIIFSWYQSSDKILFYRCTLISRAASLSQPIPSSPKPDCSIPKTSESSKSSPPKIDSVPKDSETLLEVSSPYLIHHSDHPRLVLISKPLNGDNFSGWKRAMVRALNSKKKLGFVNGSIKAPSETADPNGYAIWSRCNDMVHSWIVNSCDPEIAESVTYYPTAYEVWEDLHERFSQANATRIFEIQRDINSLRQEQLSVSVYYTKLKALWDELSTLDATQQTDQQKLMQFLMGLNETYQAIRGQILLMKPLPTVRQAFSSVLQEEKQRLIASSHMVEDSGSAAMAVQSENNRSAPEARNDQANRFSGNNNRFSGGDRSNRSTWNDRTERGGGTHRGSWNGGRRGDQNHRRFGSERRRPQCTYCGDMGHWVQTCHKLHGYPEGHPKARDNPGNFNRTAAANYASEERLVSIPEDQLKQLLSLIPKTQDEDSNNKTRIWLQGRRLVWVSYVTDYIT
ncbi:PREDICTED: uncharacterized protein LOC101305751 [Fragaria vesca subsp. vesca]